MIFRIRVRKETLGIIKVEAADVERTYDVVDDMLRDGTEDPSIWGDEEAELVGLVKD